jgi:hypothetical protein
MRELATRIVPEANDLAGRRTDRPGGLPCAACLDLVAELAALALGRRPTLGRLAPLSNFALDMRWCVVPPYSQRVAVIADGTECASSE